MFKPLISQFEKPEDPKTKNIFTQNQEMLRNQLALTEGLRDNQRELLLKVLVSLNVWLICKNYQE